MTLTADRARALLDYDAETGRLAWKRRPFSDFVNPGRYVGWNRAFAGREAGCIAGSGYRTLCVDGLRQQAHRVIWLLVFGEWPLVIDHINGERADNRLCNLRNVTNAENQKNKRPYRTSKSGVPGVTWDTQHRRWVAGISINGKRKHLGRFDRLEDAVAARQSAQTAAAYHINHGLAGKSEGVLME